MQTFWEERYAAAEYIYGTTPNQFLKAFLDNRESDGHLLLPAEGEGRNAVYAAARGWQVTAFDYSANARRKALELARSQGVGLDYQVAAVREFPFPERAYQAVGLFFAHLPPEDRRYLHRRVTDSLAPGGTVVLEAFSKEQFGKPSGGPRNEAMLYDTESLAEDFAGLRLLVLTREEVVLTEGRFHQGPASVVRLIAEKPR